MQRVKSANERLLRAWVRERLAGNEQPPPAPITYVEPHPWHVDRLRHWHRRNPKPRYKYTPRTPSHKPGAHASMNVQLEFEGG